MPLIRKDPVQTPISASPLRNAQSVLVSGTAEERWAAARELADQPDATAVLAAALPAEPQARVREAIITGLVRHGGDTAVRALLPQMRSDDAALRTEALDAFRAMPDRLEPHLLALLADPDPDVRLLSCDIARALPAERASALLCAVLERETAVNVCAAAVDALAEIGGPGAADALERCGERFPHEPFLRFAIRAAIQSIAPGPTA